MSTTYNPALPSDRDYVRFLCGDTSAPFQLQDEEIDAILQQETATSPSIRYFAAARVLGLLLTRWQSSGRGVTHKQVGRLGISKGGDSAADKALTDRIRDLRIRGQQLLNSGGIFRALSIAVLCMFCALSGLQCQEIGGISSSAFGAPSWRESGTSLASLPAGIYIGEVRSIYSVGGLHTLAMWTGSLWIDLIGVGTIGPKGDTGTQGAKGDTGATGPQGIQGPQGPQGVAGATGATGPAGAKGDKGDTGSTGVAGQDGLPRHIADEGTVLADRATLNLLGADITCVDNPGASETDCTVAGSGGGTPGGADTQLQFNDSGTFGGDTNLTYNKTLHVFTLRGTALSGGSLIDQSYFGGSGLSVTGSVAVTQDLIIGAPTSNGDPPKVIIRGQSEDIWTGSNFRQCWSDTPNAAINRETCFFRVSPHVLAIGDTGSGGGGLQLRPLSSAPVACGAGTEGVEYVNSSTHAFCYCDGTIFQVLNPLTAGVGGC